MIILTRSSTSCASASKNVAFINTTLQFLGHRSSLAVVPLLGTNFLRVFAMVIFDVLSDFDEIEHVLFEVNELEQGSKG